MNYPIVYSKAETVFTGNGLAVLEQAYEVKIHQVINGEYTLSFILPRDSPKWQYIQPENFVKVKGQLFRIRSIGEIRDSHGKLTSNIQCEHVWYDANDCKHIPYLEMIGSTPQAILTAAFSGTKFVVGAVEITTLTDVFMDMTNPAAVTMKVIELVGGELERDNYTIHLRQRLGANRGVQLRYGKNVASLQRTTDSKSIITRLYPYGKDGLQIDSVNGGVPYIDSPLINNYDRPRIGYKEYKDIEDPAELLAAAQAEWSTSDKDGIDKPKMTYSGEFLELKKLAEYGDLETFSIGDTVRMIDSGIAADTLQRVTEYEEYPYEPKRSNMSFANYNVNLYRNSRPANVVASLIGTTSYIEKTTNISGQLLPQYFENIREKLRTEINGMVQQALKHSQADMYVDSLTNPTKALILGPGIMAMANSKKPNGDWNWTTIADGDRVIATEVSADWVYAGRIDASQITTGSLSADRISGGTLSGVSINVGTDVQVGNNIYLGSSSAGGTKKISFFPSDLAKISATLSGGSGEYDMTVYASNILDIRADGSIMIETMGDVNIIASDAFINGKRVLTE